MGMQKTYEAVMVLLIILTLANCPVDPSEQGTQPEWQPVQTLTANSTGSDNSCFGKSVDICANYAIVGAYGAPEGGNSRGAAFVYVKDGSNWQLQQKLVSQDVADYDLFGSKVAVSDSYAVVASAGLPDEIEIYERNGDIWTYVSEFNNGAGSTFGCAVDISGDYVIAGDDTNDTAIIYYKNVSGWELQATLTGAADSRFGCAVALFGDYAVVGADRYDGVTFNNIGAVYIYRRNGSAWEFVKIVTPCEPADEVVNERFGHSIALSGERLLVGAPGTAKTYFLKLEGTEWVLEKSISVAELTGTPAPATYTAVTDLEVRITIPGNADIDDVKTVIDTNDSLLDPTALTYHLTQSLTTTVLFIGCPLSGNYVLENLSPATSASGVHVELTHSSGIYTLIISRNPDSLGSGTFTTTREWIFRIEGFSTPHTIDISTSAEDAYGVVVPGFPEVTGNQEYGCSVSLSAGNAVAGIYNLDDEAGSTYIWGLSNNLWEYEQTLNVAVTEVKDRCGFSVATYNNFILVGAYMDDNNQGVNAGSVYVFNLK